VPPHRPGAQGQPTADGPPPGPFATGALAQGSSPHVQEGYHPAVLKLLLLSVVLLTFLLPASAAKLARPRRAFQTLLASVLLAQVGYAFFLYFLYFRLV
jgi:hypothetical protein